MQRRKFWGPLSMSILALVVALLAAACGGDGDETEGGANGGDTGTTVRVELKDFEVIPEDLSTSAGQVTFEVENTGSMAHELAVVKTDLAPDALPLDEAVVDEDASGLEVIGRIEQFEAGQTRSGTFSLSAGNYALICNIPGHYGAGMTIGFAVS